MKLSIREQLEALGFKAPKFKGGYKEPLIFLNVDREVLEKYRCNKYGHPHTTRKPIDLRPNALRTPVLAPIEPAVSPNPALIEAYFDMYGVAYGAVV